MLLHSPLGTRLRRYEQCKTFGNHIVTLHKISLSKISKKNNDINVVGKKINNILRIRIISFHTYTYMIKITCFNWKQKNNHSFLVCANYL